ncbi:LysR family transcriptional regulator [Pseudohoeflea suaedae]|uniref:LysR family transcriptional regulator n=1 Tax=Pseudohoeflea suaedae TaxID=877384 RepID=A0A4R5PML2_9HYPH|nr:LysR family transcriptional regulator [Pseudohoeflea suaedae]TDH37771.1 LysR family transcriptional regulator [Pseudohoeflea suaedae]
MDTSLDLNLLRVFEILLEEESATRAAIRLDLTQAAVSASLARLRKVYDDPLFERTGKGLAPTPRALALAPDIRRAMDAVRASLPVETGRSHILIGMSGDIEMAYGASIVTRLRRDCPDMLPVLRPCHGANAADLLAERRIDIALGSGGLTARGLLRHSLGTSGYLGLMRGTGDTRIDMDLETFCARPQLMIAASGLTDIVDTALALMGRTRKVAAVGTHLTAVPFLLEAGMVTTLPAHAAQAIAALGGFVTFSPPVELPAYPLDLATRSSNTRDATLKTAVKAIRSVFAGE